MKSLTLPIPQPKELWDCDQHAELVQIQEQEGGRFFGTTTFFSLTFRKPFTLRTLRFLQNYSPNNFSKLDYNPSRTMPAF